MVSSRLRDFLAITLCLVACLCAHGFVSEYEAREAVENARKAVRASIKESGVNAEKADKLLKYIKSHKKSAEKTLLEAKKGAFGNAEAQGAARRVEIIVSGVKKQYVKAYALGQRYSTFMHQYLSEAETLREKPNNLRIVADSENDYTSVYSDAVRIRNDAINLYEQMMETNTEYESVYYAEQKMRQDAMRAQQEKLHIDAIVADSKTAAHLKIAKGNLNYTKHKLDEMSATLKEMKKLEENKPREVRLYIRSLVSLAEKNFTSVSSAFENSKKKTNMILKMKAKTQDAVSKIKVAKTLEEAKKKVRDANWSATIALTYLNEVQDAQLLAYRMTINIQKLKNKAVDAIKEEEKKRRTARSSEKEDSSRTEDSNRPAEGSPDSSSTRGTKQPRETEADTEQNGAPHPSTVEKSGFTVVFSKNPNWHNKRPNPLGIGGDNAMTVSVPLLLAVIAFAAVH